MTTTPALDPFTPPAFADQQPKPARLEILERHTGEKYDDKVLLCPNIVRINGVSLWCSGTEPVTVQEFSFDDQASRQIVVKLRLHARRLSAGEEPTRVVPDAPDPRNRFATVELPPVEDDIRNRDGDLSPAYAIVNGHKLLLAEPGVTIDPMVPDKDSHERVLTVTVPLLCRSVVFDDVVEEDGPAGAVR